MSQFPADFVWGTATSAYQIEGAVRTDGRGASVWDIFSHTPGKIKDGKNGDTACDHYHRSSEDIALMQELGMNAYRFSVSWPRIQPEGKGRPNKKGLGFYDRLIDQLLDSRIDPYATLFHWDLPQALEDQGGWLNRDTAHRFAEYAHILADAFQDRIKAWITLNEPFVVLTLGYALGQHAPGRTLLLDAMPVAHHQLLAHGLAVQAIREISRSPVGIAQNLAPVIPATDTDEDLQAAAHMDDLHNRLFLDPILHGEYPRSLLALLGEQAETFIRQEDFQMIGSRLDFLGVNYYAPDHVKASSTAPLGLETVPMLDYQQTGFGWPVVPEGLTQLLLDLKDRYAEKLPPIFITENGCSYPDAPDLAGKVNDSRRIEFLERHLDALGQAIEKGADVRGYFCWSLLDNFEWAEGYTQRFGLVHVDFQTFKRTPKASYYWLQGYLRSGKWRREGAV
ncbi:GH1 family beta-glucosidase [Deinococcus roseus]|uniref:Beta-glucosidase n=1 Tax=Deinococcus roseus TaxID=392414 RepID=A0ABQ2DBM1_9DEIO|nr:GH1 family beta-glucosidase [Deinococcus roseus]GGJ48820.1 beta-glucosidase [Deinococcus roseus]